MAIEATLKLRQQLQRCFVIRAVKNDRNITQLKKVS